MTAARYLSSDFKNGDVSFWHRASGVPVPRAPLPGDRHQDVAIAGAGLTGLWTAYYLKQARPDLSIAIVEKEFAGFGASGRNGGWLSGEPPGQLRRYAKSHGWEAACRMQRQMFATIDEVLAVAEAEGIDADIAKDGLLRIATNPAQLVRLTEHVAFLRKHGWGDEDLQVLSPAELGARVSVAGARGGYWTPHCARIQPAKLVTGLAAAVERLGVEIFEQTTVREILPGKLLTDLGTVEAGVVLSALEGYTPSLRGEKRSLLPMNSSMIVTNPLSDQAWGRIGWHNAELVADQAHSYAYCQRTADGRIAIGGRGVPYNYASSFDRSGRTADKAIDQLIRRLAELFPGASEAGIQHAWSGVLGVPRDWCASVRFDPTTGVGFAGGYVGHGVSGANLAGRTLRDVVLDRDTALSELPWVGRTTRRWEFEPWRWVGATALYAAYRSADAGEARSGKPRTRASAKVADWVSGRS